MTKVWKFLFLRGADEIASSYHETEEAAYRAAADALLTDMLDELDFSDSDQRDIVRQVLAHAEHGDFEAAVKAYLKGIDDADWNEVVTIEAIPLVAGFDIQVMANVLVARKALTEAEAEAEAKEDEAVSA